MRMLLLSLAYKHVSSAEDRHFRLPLKARREYTPIGSTPAFMWMMALINNLKHMSVRLAKQQ